MLLSLLLACTGSIPESDAVEKSTSTGCRTGPPPAEQPATLLFSTPYNEGAGQSPLWRTALLGETLSLQPDLLDLGRAIDGSPQFTPDGSWGVAVLEDGTLSSVVVNTEGQIDPLDLGIDLGIFARAVEISQNGEELWILDSNWPENGGGLYKSRIDCDTGSLSVPELQFHTKNAAALLTADDGLWIAAREADGVAGQIHHFQDRSLESIQIFGDDEAILSDIAQTKDGRIVVSDINEFSGIPTRIGWMDAEGQIGEMDVGDPTRLLASPLSEQLLILSGYDNAAYLLEGNALSEPNYVGAAPQLPTSIVGMADGQIYISENQGIRSMRFGVNGIEDMGVLLELEGLSGITGALGINR